MAVEKIIGEDICFSTGGQKKATLGTTARVVREKKDSSSGLNIEKIADLEIPEIPSDEEIRAESDARKKGAAILADKTREVDDKIAAMEAAVDGDRDILSANTTYKKLLDIRERLKGAQVDAGTKASADVALVIGEIAACQPLTPEEVVILLKKVAKMGRGDILSSIEAEKIRVGGKYSPTVVVFKMGEVVLFPKIEGQGEITPANRKIFYELKKLVERYYGNLKSGKACGPGIAEILAEGNRNLGDLINNKPGLYAIYFPLRTEGDKKFYEGAVLVDLEDRNRRPGGEQFLVIRAIRGAGAMKWVSDISGFWLPIAAFFTGKIREEKFADNADLLEGARKFARILNTARKVWEYEMRVQVDEKKRETLTAEFAVKMGGSSSRAGAIMAEKIKADEETA